MNTPRTSHFLNDHSPDVGKMVLTASAINHFFGLNKMVGSGQSPKDAA